MKVKTLGLVAGLALSGTALAQGQPQTQPEQAQQAQGQMAQGEYKVEGTVVGTKEKRVFVKQADGAIVALEVNHETLVDGQHIKKDQRIESHLKREFTEGEQVRASFDTKKLENVATSIEQAPGQKK